MLGVRYEKRTPADHNIPTEHLSSFYSSCYTFQEQVADSCQPYKKATLGKGGSELLQHDLTRA
jgi:hypothetical protein